MDDTPRKFSLHEFPHITYDTEIKLSGTNNPLKTITDNFRYSQFNYDSQYNYYFDGYWQSEKYFKGAEQIIRNELSPTKEIAEKLKSPIHAAQNFISLHIRRTDYLKFSAIHPVLPVEYYERAVEAIGKYDYILVFSDDIEWCRDNLRFERMIFSEHRKEVEDLWLMSLCTHHIIANSSFSWWGAWLNNNPLKKVVAPARWFGNQLQVSMQDIIPDNWIVL
jgi:hypothetical protein